MNLNLDQALHVVSGKSAAGALKAALGVSRQRVLINEDLLSYGPAPATDDLLHWRHTREKFLHSIARGWPGSSKDHYAANDLLNNTASLAEENPIIVWASPSLSEQLLIAWLVFLFDQLQLDFSRLLVIQIEYLNPDQSLRPVAELSPKHIQQKAPEAWPLSTQQTDEYRRAWTTYTSSDPIDLMRFLSSEPDSRLLLNAIKQLVYRYPSVETGLCRHDEEIIRHSSLNALEVAQIIGQAMNSCDHRDTPDDGYLFHRLLRLCHPHRSRPLLTLTGDRKNKHSCHARLTRHGQAVLEGNPGNLQDHDIDDWIGGVHLHKTMSIPFRIKDELYLPM